ncbi:adenosylcobinamide-GDP ribazoletransferase [Pectinatus sottacetonis]|uniref:adenosylcobinamide-GDP ribazoletransferase n=1 Tax=Pectinatus sottacetonis TaxID=1002795 RepID=UPI0018C4B769|nr:adenosylcobinamide-GDP ribazoletransferase [Pectinatus sottacetonis]
MNSFFTGLLFLTRIPIKYNASWTEQACGSSVKYFAVIGAILGIINSLGAFILLTVFPHIFNINIPVLLGSFFLLTLNIISTGAIHCDGYTDTMDGLLSGRKKERMLEIMKDSRVGAHGTTSLIMLLLGKYSAIAALYTYTATDPFILCSALFLMPVIGRLSMVIGITLFPYARKEGLGKAFSLYSNKNSLYIVLSSVIICLIINYPYFWQGLYSLILVSIFAFIFCRYVTGKLGGLTGDVYGATTEISELFVLIIYAVF